MNTASLENCKKLYELSSWGSTEFVYYSNADTYHGVHHKNDVIDKPNNLPAYDLGYLLRKLPGGRISELLDGSGYRSFSITSRESGSRTYTCDADTPEDAVALLAIKLFEEGILKK